MPIRISTTCDGDQSQKSNHFITCPKCRQKLADVEYLKGMGIMRFKCRRCGTYIKADLVGVE